MSCGGNGKAVAPGAPWVLNDDNYKSPTYKQPKECDEGYLARAGNPEKNMSGGLEESNKIRNVSVPVGLDMSLNTAFELTSTSTITPDQIARWELSPLPPGAVFDKLAGKLSGTITVPGKYSITVSAIQSNGSTIDTKSYSLVAQKTTGDESIKFIHPLPGSVITSRCTASVDGTKVWSDPKRGRPHKGIDLAYPGGKLGNVCAAASGQVIRADGNDANGYGNLVIIGHTNSAGKKMCLSVYAHLSSIVVEVGQQVAAGDLIGVEGNTGGSHGAHLHFEIRGADFCSGAGSNQNSAVYDPSAYITGQVSFDDKSASSAVAAGKEPDPGVVVAKPDEIKKQDNGPAVGLTPNKVDNKCSGYVPEPGNPTPPVKNDYFKKTVPDEGMLTVDQLIGIAPSTKSKAGQFVPLINATFAEFGINTKARKKAFVAQVLHESGRLIYLKEIASGAKYEGRKDLGNTQPGDGIKYKGRGLIQITGRANYTKAASALGIDCVNNPSLLEQPENAVRVSGWFWKTNGCNEIADTGDFVKLTKRINGGTNGLSDRQSLLSSCNTVCPS
jgi:putative chitinase